MRHQAQNRVFGGVDRAGDVQSAAFEDFERGLGDVDPHPFAEDFDGWVVDFDCIEDAAFLVDFEEAEDDLVDFDGAVEGTGKGVGDAADGFGFDGVDVCVVALLGGPVDVDAEHFGVF